MTTSTCQRLASAMLVTMAFIGTCQSESLPPPKGDLSRFEKGTEGWFFYKEPKDKPKPPLDIEPPAPPPPPVPPAPAAPVAEPLKPMSVAWMQKYLPIVKEAAIDDPSPKNVRIFLYMQRIMLDKADNFTRAAVLASSNDPGLNEDVRVPRATAYAQQQNLRVVTAQNKAMRLLTGKAALWVFVDSKCVHCQMATTAGRRFAQKWGYEFRLISVDGVAPKKAAPEEVLYDKNRSAFRRFGLKLVPATLLAMPPDNVSVIAHGAVTDDFTLETNVVASMLNLKLVPEELSAVLQAKTRGLLTPENIKSAETQALAALDRNSSKDEPPGSRATTGEPTPSEVVDLISSIIEKNTR